MPIRRRFLCCAAVCVLLSHFLLAAENPESTPTIHDRINGMKTADGLFPTAWDAKNGQLFLTIHKFDQDFLLVVSLPYGLGSNDIGLDRGRWARTRSCILPASGRAFCWSRRICNTVRPPRNPMEHLAVRQSFAESVLAGFKVEAEEDGAVLVDATDFLAE